MSTSAQLYRKLISAHGQHANFVTVFLTKQGRSTRRNGGLHIHFLGKYLSIGTHLIVYDCGNLRQLISGHRLGMREIKTQFISIYQRAFLLYVISQNLSKRFMHQVRCRVIHFDTSPQRCIDNGIDLITCIQRALNNENVMQMVPLGFGCVADLKPRRVSVHVTCIANLTTALTVERGSI